MTAPAVDPWADVRHPLIERPFPLAPLLEACRTTSVCRLAFRLGVRQSTVTRAAIDGLSDTQADRWAIALGFHPAELWPSIWWSTCPDWDEGDET